MPLQCFYIDLLQALKDVSGNEWVGSGESLSKSLLYFNFRPLQKSTLTNSNENLDSYDPSPSINPNQHPNSDSLGYRSLIESSDYRSLLVDDNFNSNPVKETIEDKLR